MIDKPQVNIFALCERVIVDRGGKPSLLGVFDVMNFPAFPAPALFFLFTQITAPRGNYQVAVHFGRVDTLNQPVFKESREVVEGSGVAHLLTQLNLTFSEPGLYEFRLYIDDVPKLTRPFHVRQVG